MEISIMDNRDYRIRIDITFDPSDVGVANGLYNHCRNQLNKAINIDVNNIPPEVSFVSLERCGHRIGESCTETKREEKA